MRRAALLLAGLVAAAPALAAVGGTSGEVLSLGLGARPLAMGGAYIAVSDDLSGVQYNPAGVGAVRRYGVDVHYSDLYEGISYGGVSLAVPAPKRTTLALNYFQLDSGAIPKTIATNRGLFVEDNGSFSVKDTVIGAAIGTGLYDPVEFGIGVKQVSESIDGSKGNGTMIDAGFVWSIGSRVRLGASAQNLGGSLEFPGQEEDVPQIMGAGLAVKLLSAKNLLLAADVTDDDSRGARTTMGAEYVVLTRRRADAGEDHELQPLMALRAGFRPDDADDLGSAAGVTFGVGFFLASLRLDYAFVDAGDLGLTHRASFGFSFGKRRDDDIRDEMDFSTKKSEKERNRAIPTEKTKGGRHKLR